MMRIFIKERLNKDNFWNLMFFLIMFAGMAIAFATDIMILSWITIIGAICLVKRNSNIFFNEDKLEFVINGDKKIKTSGAEFILIMFASLNIMAIVGFVLDNLEIDNSPILLAMMMILLILLPTLYCIIRNFPIAVYFKKEAWIDQKSSEVDNFDDHWRHNAHHVLDHKNTCMSYDYLPSNMYYSSYRNRYHK